jgi:hypothetical protein
MSVILLFVWSLKAFAAVCSRRDLCHTLARWSCLALPFYIFHPLTLTNDIDAYPERANCLIVRARQTIFGPASITFFPLSQHVPISVA